MLVRNAHKGDAMAVECVVRPSRWTDKEGQTRYDVNLYIERVLWISRKRAAAVAPDVGVAAIVEVESDPAPATVEGDEAAGEELPF
jgi:single-stranded DNA-binding protein